MTIEHQPKDLPLSRIVDRIDVPEDWRRLRRAASVDETVYAELIDWLEQDAELRAATHRIVAVADQVELQSVPAGTLPHGLRVFLHGPLFGMTGWLAAALLAVFWLGDQLASDAPPAAPRTTPLELLSADGGLFAAGPSDETVDRAALARAFPELPPILVRAEPLESGGYDVVWMRRTFEQASVPELFGVAYDEYGEATPVPYQGLAPRITRDF